MDIEEYLAADALLRRNHRNNREYRETVRLHKAFMLAPNIWIAHALLLRERIPWRQFDPQWAERFGVRRRTRDGRYNLDDFNDVPRV
jgi:hypothetical protein